MFLIPGIPIFLTQGFKIRSKPATIVRTNGCPHSGCPGNGCLGDGCLGNGCPGNGQRAVQIVLAQALCNKLVPQAYCISCFKNACLKLA